MSPHNIRGGRMDVRRNVYPDPMTGHDSGLCMTIPDEALFVYKERDRKYGWKHCYRRLPLGLRVVLQSACADTVNAAEMAFVV
jgi:hypothetical protein